MRLVLPIGDRLNFVRSCSWKYRSREPIFSSSTCCRQNLVLLAVTRVAGYGLQGPCRPQGQLGEAFECGWGARFVSAVIALCSPRRVLFVVVS
jgi:hypothetical protein